jgi:hypothetical protein
MSTLKGFIDAITHLQAARYTCAAGGTVLLYDILLTTKDEVRLIWPSRFSLVKVLYFIVSTFHTAFSSYVFFSVFHLHGARPSSFSSPLLPIQSQFDHSNHLYPKLPRPPCTPSLDLFFLHPFLPHAFLLAPNLISSAMDLRLPPSFDVDRIDISPCRVYSLVFIVSTSILVYPCFGIII